MKSSHLTTSADVLQSLLENGKFPLSDQFLRWKLWCKWSEVVGKSLGENSAPVYYQSGALHVWVRSASWMQQMIFLVQPLRAKINDFAGRDWIRRIQFTLDRHSVPHLEDCPTEVREFFSRT